MDLYIYGAGGSGRETASFASRINESHQYWDNIFFIDDKYPDGSYVNGYKCFSINYVKDLTKFENVEFFISAGEPFIREELFNKVRSINSRAFFTNLISDRSVVSDFITIGQGVKIGLNSSISPNVIIRDNVFIQGPSTLGHDVVVGENTVVSSYSFIGGETKIGKNVYIAPHSAIRNGISIGDNSIVGMGSVVTKDVPDNVVVYGNPAKVVRENTNNRVFKKY